MASTVLKSPPTFTAYLTTTARGGTIKSHNFRRVSFVSTKFPVIRCRTNHGGRNQNTLNFPKRKIFAANGGETAEAAQTEEKVSAEAPEPEIEANNVDVAIDESETDTDTENDAPVTEEEPSSLVVASLNIYKEALANNDESKIAEVESFLKTIEDEKVSLEAKVATLSEELSYERTRVLRVSADFDNFRKRTDRERLSLVSNAQGEVVEGLLPVLDNFERAKAQIKVETEGEEKISNSYQNIYKQFVEILGSLGVVPVESVGKQFDPMLHEAIMREDSTEYEDGVIIEEYRKGFQLAERLLRPSMVKVSAGPGPSKPETEEEQKDQEATNEATGESTAESTPTEE